MASHHRPAYAVGPPLPPSAQRGPSTMVDALRALAKSGTTRGITYLGGGSTVVETYTELLHAARCMLHGLQGCGLRQGEALVMQISELQPHVRALWGCFLGGITPVNIAIPGRYVCACSPKLATRAFCFLTWR